MTAASKSKAAPLRAAVLFYGVLNSFPRIYGADAGGDESSIPRLLEAAGIDYDVFVHTEDKGFFKNFPPEAVADSKIYGLDILGITKDSYYTVAECPPELIETWTRDAFGERLVSLVIENSPYDPDVWEAGSMYNTMIKIFFFKKKEVFEEMRAYAEREGKAYDLVFLVRPDSRIRARLGKSSLTATADRFQTEAREYLAAVADGRKLCMVDCGAYQLNAALPDKKIIKNDFVYGDLVSIDYMVALYDRIIEKDGAFKNIYPERSLRCVACMTLHEDSEACPACGSTQPATNVTNWPEYKMHEHMVAGGYETACSCVTGGVLR
jgi:hypothetical protein